LLSREEHRNFSIHSKLLEKFLCMKSKELNRSHVSDGSPMVAKQHALKHMQDLISTFFFIHNIRPNSFLHFSYPSSKRLLSQNSYVFQSSILHPSSYHIPTFFPIPVFWILRSKGALSFFLLKRLLAAPTLPFPLHGPPYKRKRMKRPIYNRIL
jgi:hypothetical protein